MRRSLPGCQTDLVQSPLVWLVADGCRWTHTLNRNTSGSCMFDGEHVQCLFLANSLVISWDSKVFIHSSHFLKWIFHPRLHGTARYAALPGITACRAVRCSPLFTASHKSAGFKLWNWGSVRPSECLEIVNHVWPGNVSLPFLASQRLAHCLALFLKYRWCDVSDCIHFKGIIDWKLLLLQNTFALLPICYIHSLVMSQRLNASSASQH